MKINGINVSYALPFEPHADAKHYCLLFSQNFSLTYCVKKFTESHALHHLLSQISGKVTQIHGEDNLL